jgi:hypothetical protein
MTKLKTLSLGIALSLSATPVLAGSYAGSADVGPSRGSQTPVSSSGPTSSPAATIVLPSSPELQPASGAEDADAEVGDGGDDGDDAWTPPDPGPQYSDNSIGSGFREQAARLDDAADDIEAARGDVAQAQADGDADATMMQASGVAKVVESTADGAMALAGEVGGPELEPVVQLYGQAKGAAGAWSGAVDGNDAGATVEAGKAIGETVGADSTVNRAVNGAAAAYDAANGEYVKAAGEAMTAAGGAYVGGMVQAQAGVGEGVVRYVEGGEQRERIDRQAEAADEQMAEQEAAIRDRADDLRATAASVDDATTSSSESSSGTDDGGSSGGDDE